MHLNNPITRLNYLDICYKRCFISYLVSIKDLLKRQDPLVPYILQRKSVLVIVLKKQCARPYINTERFKSAFVNRLIFKRNLSIV